MAVRCFRRPHPHQFLVAALAASLAPAILAGGNFPLGALDTRRRSYGHSLMGEGRTPIPSASAAPGPRGGAGGLSGASTLEGGNLTGGVLFAQRRGNGFSLLGEGRPLIPAASAAPGPLVSAGGLSCASVLSDGQPGWRRTLHAEAR